MKTILTYGTFDILHYGHIRLLKRAKALGDKLIVALSTDEFCETSKGKKTFYDYSTRKEMLEAIKYVDEIIPENNWEQKTSDVLNNNVNIVVMGSDWSDSDKFEFLKEYCNVVYLERTPDISTSQLKKKMGLL